MSIQQEDLLIGAHTSAAGGVHKALYEGKSIGATAIQLFTANQKRWKSKALTPEAIALWKKAKEETGINMVMSHDSYLINLGSPDPENLRKSRDCFRSEIERCLALEVNFLNFHPGASVGCDGGDCLNRICESLLEYEELLKNHSLRLLLENTAGQGTSIGYEFDQLEYIIDKVKAKIPIGVCLDTCHLFAAGYDIRNAEAWDKTLNEFDRVVGLEHLYAFHVNDSAKALGSRVDRHHTLGNGLIGIDCFKYLMRNPKTRRIPKFLETPEGLPVWRKEILMLREFAKETP